MQILVTGATGMLGRAAVRTLTQQGAAVRALSRHAQPPVDGVEWMVGDLTTGDRVAEAVGGVDIVLHLASAPYKRGYTAQVEIDGTTLLLAESANAGVQHLIYTSIIGCDQIPWGYFRTKVAAEKLVQHGEVPWTILRAAQYFDFVDQAFTMAAKTPVMVGARGIAAQPVDVRDVSTRIASLVDAGPRREITEFAGPEVLDLDSAARAWLEITGTRRPVLPIRVPGKLGRAFRAGHLTTTATPRGERTWRDYLTEEYRS